MNNLYNCLEYLLDSDANINIKNIDSYTPLNYSELSNLKIIFLYY